MSTRPIENEVISEINFENSLGNYDVLEDIIRKWPDSYIKRTIDRYSKYSKEIPPYLLKVAQERGFVPDDKH